VKTIRRNTARVLPVNQEGRVLLLHGWDPAEPDNMFWFTIGGAAEPGETLREAAARELREEVGITVDQALLGEPIETAPIEFSWAGVLFVQDQTFYAIARPEAEVSFAGQDALERSTIDKHGWLLPGDLGSGDDRPADPQLPRLMRLAAAAVFGPAGR
jgi:8-oxo-dGTP pyrophosphatase MutT (NUDIX family)